MRLRRRLGITHHADMTPNRRTISLISSAAAALAAVTLAACGGGSSTSSTPSKPAGSGTETVDVASSSLGTILVDSHGRTLYLFKKDSGTTSTCFGACAANWPPLRTAGKPTVGTGADASSVATAGRSDGKPEVTYNRHPLYLFAGDEKPGDTNGQGIDAFGGKWLVLSPAGDAIAAASSGSGGGSGGY
jgi:predicted lipoprotein with Yx(FWY)xxD motif